MQLPTPEEVLAAKGEAVKKFGKDEALLVRCPAPIDFCVLVAPLNLASYCALSDDQHADVGTGQRNALYRQLLWPARNLVEAKLGRRPAFAEEVTRALNKRAGYAAGNSEVETLEDVIKRTAKDSEVIPGLSLVAAQKLIAELEGEELWAVVGPGPLSCVMATPPGDVWLAARTKNTDTMLRTAKRVVQTSLEFVLQAVKWSREPLEDSLLNDKPALSVDLQRAYDTIGGSGAEATTKSL